MLQTWISKKNIPTPFVCNGQVCKVIFFFIMQQQMIIKFYLKLGKTATETYKMLKTVSENVAVSHVCVLNWLKDSVRDVGP
jgi:hypothetical protein